MSTWLWVLIGILVVMFIINFITLAPDLLPWRRRNRKK